MANEEHLKILKQGVEAWNRWRLQSSRIAPDLTGVDLSQEHLGRPDLVRTNLCGANLQDADFEGANVRIANFAEANLSRANFSNAQLAHVILSRANLSRANLASANLVRVHLDGANLRGANLQGASLFETDLSGAELRGVRLREAKLAGASLAGVHIRGAQLGYTTFANVDLSKVKGLETIQHTGPSTIGIDTIYRSKGNIPEIFLRGAGVPEDFIIYMKSLVGRPIEFYSCFISYSSKEDDFARRLHADLQQNNVRVWFAPEDLKIGDKFRTLIDESIRVHDKLMVVLSSASIQSPWVEEEVEAAFEKERKENKLVLFPIALDNAVMVTERAWGASLRRTRHIGDFRNWKDHDAYKVAFDRLLRDLKAENTVATGE
jgi:TIR domain-containing protein/pentapeptide repeat protein